MIKGLMFFVRFSWAHEKRYLVFNVLNQFISSMIPITAVIMPRYIIDELMGPCRPAFLAAYISILAGYTFLASAASGWLVWTAFTHRIKLAQAFSCALHKKTATADYADIESSAYLEMKEKADKFLFGDWKGFSYVLDLAVNCIGKAFTLVGVVAVVARLSPTMVLLFSALVLISSYTEARVRRRQADMQLGITSNERRTVYYAKVLEDFAYGKEIRVNNLGGWLLHREKQHWEISFETYKKSNALGIRQGVFNSLAALAQQATAYTYLAVQAAGGAITMGDFSMYAAGTAAFSGAMRDLMQGIVEIGQFRKYYDALDQYLNIPAKMRENQRLPVPQGPYTIEFCDVSFCYPGQQTPALENVNLTIIPGQKLSIVGENGAGKSTFVKLLCRIYDPTQGKILLNGTDIRDIDYDQYTALFSTVFQDYRLFALPLRDNVALGQSDSADPRAVEGALRRAGLGQKLDSLPRGIDTPVYRNFEGEGFEPSGGEGQKIALARALFKDAPMVILDEPAASLDPRAEYEMYQGFSSLVGGKTAVYISHRLSSARFCDSIAVFCGGEIIQHGSHHDLLAKEGLYARLWHMQAGYYS